MNKKTLFGMLAATVLATVPALAQTQQKGQQPGPQVGSFAQQQVEGRITDVDKDKGTVSIQTEQHGQLDFKLSPQQMQRLNEGDQVRLQIQLQYMPKQQQPQGGQQGQ